LSLTVSVARDALRWEDHLVVRILCGFTAEVKPQPVEIDWYLERLEKERAVLQMRLAAVRLKAA
jgi:hypothetical protein